MSNIIVFADTSAFYALLDKNDKNHNMLKDIFSSEKYSFVTSNYIFDELITLFVARGIPINNYLQFIDSLLSQSLCPILRISEDLEIEAWRILVKYQEHKFSFTDCTSFALMEKYCISSAATLDKHFEIFGFSIITV